MLKELKKLQKYQEPITDSRYHKPYVEGFVDYYVGITVPKLRRLSKQHYKTISNNELYDLLQSKIHEYRLFALITLVYQYQKSSVDDQGKIVAFYLENIKQINNWDLVDLSAYQILGDYCYKHHNFDILIRLSKSNDLWEKRISIVSTYTIIKNKQFDIPIKIITHLLEDKHDLIHKANGWMLRNIGDIDETFLTEYIKENYQKMPRTTLRYAIEHFEETKRKAILRGNFYDTID